MISEERLDKLMEIEDVQTLKNEILQLIAEEDAFGFVTSYMRLLTLYAQIMSAIAQENRKSGDTLVDNRFRHRAKRCKFLIDTLWLLIEEGDEDGRECV